jgi:regulator of sigma E protease
MEFLINLLQGSLSGFVAYFVPMVILLGLLIFVHELGHFLVAKYYGVRVEVFSLGFGPKIFKFKRGDTVYAVSALPLGGYVKMFGDDPTADVSPDLKSVSFTHKPVGQRIAVVLAGPLMNLFFAIVLFAGVAMIGEPALSPKIGDIETTTPAYAAGFRSGDTVLAAGSAPVKTWDEFLRVVERNAGNKIPVMVERGAGDQETIEITPKLAQNKNVLSWDRQVGEIEGLTYSSRASVVGVKGPSTAAARAGLQTGDLIQKINGVEVSKWREVLLALDGLGDDSITMEVERGLLSDDISESRSETRMTKVEISISVPTDAQGSTANDILSAIGVEFPELYLAGIEKNSPADRAGLKKGDRLISVNGEPIQSFDQVAGIIRSYGQGATGDPKPLEFVVARKGDPMTIALSPNMKERMSPQGKEERRFEVGIRPLIVDALPSTIELTASNPVEAVSRGLSQTMKWTSLTVLSFVRLFQAEVSPKNIGGFISIGQMAKKSWQIGPSQFLNIMAIISINLFILNLLPVPVLDGGHLVFYSIEALRGAPLSMRKMEIAQQVGLVLLLGLMVFALFNDVTRIFN